MSDNKIRYIEATWENSILEQLKNYIKIPNKSPLFDADWESHGYMDEAIELAANWCRANAPRDMSLDILRLPNRPPVLLIDIPGMIDETVLLYGHLDKQPEMTGWAEGLSPWVPVLKDNKLYGRGGADDGYAVFASLTAINALQKENIPHPRCVILIECSEESGSPDLPYYIDAYQDKVGEPSVSDLLGFGLRELRSTLDDDVTAR